MIMGLFNTVKNLRHNASVTPASVDTDEFSLWESLVNISSTYASAMLAYPAAGYSIADVSELPYEKTVIKIAVMTRMSYSRSQEEKSYWESLLLRLTYFQPKVGQEVFKNGINWGAIHREVVKFPWENKERDETREEKYCRTKKAMEFWANYADESSARKFHKLLFEVEQEQRKWFQELQKWIENSKSITEPTFPSIQPQASPRQSSSIEATSQAHLFATATLPSRNDECECGSGKRFKRCCGQQSAQSILNTPSSRNSLCACGSGKRFKHCHGKLNSQLGSS